MSVKDLLLPYASTAEVTRLKQLSQPAPTTERIYKMRILPQPRYTRIDFFQVNVGIELGLHEIKWGWRIAKYIDGWTATTKPYIIAEDPPMKSTDGTEAPFEIDTALAHLAEHGWTIHRWQAGLNAGARAWLGPVLPIRNRAQINRMRGFLTHNLSITQGHTTISTQVDLAFDY